MKVLLDVGVSHRLRRPLQNALGGTPVESAIFRYWNQLRDDELLQRAHAQGFTALVTTDKRLAAEQRVLPLAVIAVDDNRLPALVAAVNDIADAIRIAGPAEHALVAINASNRTDPPTEDVLDN